jgi:hypothetical protein
MTRRLAVVSVFLVMGIMLGCALSPMVSSGPFMTPSETARAALLQIRNEFSDMLPSQTWGGWNGDEAGVTEGGSEETPTVGFDQVTIYLPPDNGASGYPDAAGLTWPLPPYGENSNMGISISRAYVDSDLLRMKTVLFHELVHVSQWRDTDGHYDNVGGNMQVNGSKEANLTDIKEIQASGLTLKFLQKLLNKGEFSKNSIKYEIRREMKNLQDKLKDAVRDAKNITSQGWGADLLRKWLPSDLVRLIIMKKLAYYGFATAGTIRIEDVAHVNAIKEDVEVLDGDEDGLIGGYEYGKVFVESFRELRDEKEIRGHPLVNSVQSYYRGEFGASMNQLSAYVNHVEAQRHKLGDEVSDDVLEFVDDMIEFMLGVDVFPPQPEIIYPLDGMVVGGWVMIEVVELTGADDVASTIFSISPDGAIWTQIGFDNDPTDGWWMEWDSALVPNGPYIIMAEMDDFAGNSGSSVVSIVLDN